MSANGGDGMSTGEAADFLRDLRDNVGPDALQETFNTGSGLMTNERSGLQEAIEVLGERRAAEILGVDVPNGGVPGEQRTIEGEAPFPDVPTERAKPAPEGVATLSGFQPDDGPTSEERRLIDRAASLATSTDPFSGDDPPTCTRLYTTVEQFIEMIESADRPPIGVDASREVADSLRSVTSNVDIAANTTGCFGDARGAVNRAMANAVSSIEAGEEPNIEHLRTVLQRAREGGDGDCEAARRQLEGAIQSAARQGAAPTAELMQPVDVARRRGCIDDDGDRRLKSLIDTFAGDREGADMLLEAVAEEFDEGNR